MWLTQLSENLSANVSIDSIVSLILFRVSYLWFWVIIASTILTALFLVVTLAQIEAGTSVKSRWLKLTLCSLAVTAGLIIFKPRTDLEKINFQPSPLPLQETVEKPKDTVQKNSTSGTTDTSSGGKQGQAKGALGKAQGEPGVKGSSTSQGPPSIQEKLSESLQKKGANGKFEYKDPVLEEILELKRQAEEESKKASAEGNPAEQSDHSGSSVESQQSNKKEAEQPEQKTVKARVLVTPLNIRDKGSMEGRVVGSLNVGDGVEVIGQVGDSEWVHIRLSNGQTGWVNKKYLQILP